MKKYDKHLQPTDERKPDFCCSFDNMKKDHHEALTALEQMKQREQYLAERYDVIREDIPKGYRLVYVKKQKQK